MNKWQVKFSFFVLWLALALLYFKPYYRQGLPLTHDGENHIARFAQYYLALKQGQIMPRLAPNLMNGFGYPVFNFNYPLANILSLPLSVVKIHYELSFKIIIIFFYLLAGFSFWQWIKKLFPYHKQPLIPFLTFALSPYLYQAIFFRGNIGEVLSWCLLPVIAWQIERYRLNLKASGWFLLLSLWSFFLSHNIMVLLLTPLITLYAWWRLNKKPQKRNFIFTLILALVMSLWFWLPALCEKKFTVLDEVSLNQEYQEHFITLEQLLTFNFSAGFSEVGQVDGLSYGLGSVLLVVFLLSLLLLPEAKNFFYRPVLACLLSFLALILIYLQTNYSAWWWQVLPLMNYLQFPWRLSMILQLILVLQLANLKLAHHKQRFFWLILLSSQLLFMMRAWPTDFFTHEREHYWLFPQTTTILSENRARTFIYDISCGNQGQPFIFSGAGEIRTINKFNGSQKEYQVQCETPQCIVIEETAYFIGFETRVDGQVVPYVNNEVIGGRLAYQISQGQHQIQTKFTQKTPARLWGQSLFVIALVILWWRRHQINRNQW